MKGDGGTCRSTDIFPAELPRVRHRRDPAGAVGRALSRRPLARRQQRRVMHPVIAPTRPGVPVQSLVQVRLPA